MGFSDINIFVRGWNKNSSAEQRIIGKRAHALKFLFEVAPPAFLDLVLEHVGEFTWDVCMWSEDGLACKKIYPGFQFSARSKQFAKWLRVSGESCLLMAKRAQNVFKKTPSFLRKKVPCDTLEEMSETATAVWGMACEVVANHPVDLSDVTKVFLDPWAEGCEHIDNEVQVALMDKSDTFDPSKHITVLKEIVNTARAAPSADPAHAIEEGCLEVDTFNLLMKNLKFEEQSCETWKAKCAKTSNANYWAKQDRRKQMNESAKTACSSYIKRTVKFFVADEKNKKCEKVNGAILEFRREVAGPARLRPEDIAYLPVLNWSTPCQIDTKMQQLQNQVLTWCLVDNLNSMALVLYPAFTYNAGKLHMEEAMATKLLSSGNHNLDYGFSLCFKDRRDTRDERPMTYAGKLIFPSVLKSPKSSPFGKCRLADVRRTNEVQQAPTSLMKVVEDLNADALPPTTDVRECLKGVHKFCQLGPDASLELLRSCMEGIDEKQVPGLIIVDLWVNVAELVVAFLLNRQTSLGEKTFYFGLCESQVEADWAENMIFEEVKRKFLENQLDLPGIGKPQAEDVKEDAMPPKPVLKYLTINGEDDTSFMTVSQELVKQWLCNPKFGQDFKLWIDNFVANGNKVQEVAPAADVPRPLAGGGGEHTPGKRGGEAMGEGSPPAKKAKVASKFIQSAESITESILFDVNLKASTKGEKAVFNLRSNHTVYIINKGEKEFSHPAGEQIIGFGKGAFKNLKDTPPTDEQLPYVLSPDDEIVMNNTRMLLSTVLQNQRQAEGDVKLAYHKVCWDTVDPKKFTVEVTHHIAFAPLPTQEVNANNVATQEKVSFWSKNEVTTVLWHCRWTAKGLMPVKPAVFLKGQLVLQPGECCRISTDAGESPALA